MNTKTMRLPPRRALTSNKRKDITEAEPSTPPKRLKPSAQPQPIGSNQESSDSALSSSCSSSNHLVAGYLAHEFLTRGTLFGQRWDPVETEDGGLSGSDSKVKRSREREAELQIGENFNGYVEVANLLNQGGAHLPGIINPSQLAQFLRS